MTTRRIVSCLVALATAAVVLALSPARADAAPLTGATNVATGAMNSCAVVAGGQVRCWGAGTYGQVGDGTIGFDRNAGVLVIKPNGTPLTGAKQVTIGHEFACARMANKQVRCWGRNTIGQLGNGTHEPALRATLVRNGSNTAPLSNITQIDAGSSHVCARRTDGTARCWGADTYGALGDGPDGFGAASPLPVPVSNVAGTATLKNVVQVTAGIQHSCARLKNGQARCWGADHQGQLGNSAGFGTSYSRPVAVLRVDGTANLGNVERISAGGHTTCAVLGNGQARCWGDGGDGELGEGNDVDRGLPVVVEDPGANPDSHLDNTNLVGVTAVSVGWDHTCFRMVTTQVRCAGRDSSSQLGDPSNGSTSVPRPVRNEVNTAPLDQVVQVAAGQRHTCARLSTGAVLCWGADSRGQIGNGVPTGAATTPDPVQA